MRLLIPAVFALASTAFAQPALTVYNQGFAVVRERVPLDLRAGETAFAFSGVTSQLEPDSVVLRDPAGRVPVRILEQSYRADVMSQSLLLSLNEGKELEFLVRDQNAKEFRVRGRVIRSGHNPGGQPAAPQAAKVEAELGYVTGGLSWQAAYNLVAPEKGDALDIVGWISVSNESGKVFENAAMKLMAGDVNRVQPQAPLALRARGMVMQAMAADAAVTEKAFDEFHLYTLPRPVTLRDRETKQVEFMRATGVRAPVIYVYDGAGQWGRFGGAMNRDPGYGAQGEKKVAVMREFKNSEANRYPITNPMNRFLRLLTPAALVAATAIAFAAENAPAKKAPPPPPLPGAGTGGSTPHATTSGVIGPNRREGSMITISYGRPFAVHPRKGGEARKIWGGLVAWGKADRLGADEATSIILQHPIETGGVTIPAGAYTLYIIPQEGEGSKLAFSKAIGKWGVPVDESADQARVALTRESLDKAVDQLTISVENNPQKPMSGFIRIKWEKTQFSLPLTVKK